jgi:hypothetical protein
MPQSKPCSIQFFGQQPGLPQTFGVGTPQTCGHELDGHTPQLMVPPHPSEAMPQLNPCSWQVIGAQPPQTWAIPPPPQVWGAWHAPQ